LKEQSRLHILALDTALMSCGVAVVAGKAICRRVEPRARGHAERLMPLVGEVLAEAGLGFTDLDLIAVTTGPGTFTGLRIGLAAAQGLGLALHIPVVGVTTLAVTAASAFLALKPQKGDLLAVFHDARRSEVYGELFELMGWDDDGLPEMRTLTAAAALPVDQAATLLPAKGWAAGSGVRLLPHPLPDEVAVVADMDHPDPAVLARLALRAHVTGQAGPARPVYLRAPDAKLPDTSLSAAP
jgi:tRNA threonylcarbamoyladenosine biosynthesis protein TsaB